MSLSTAPTTYARHNEIARLRQQVIQLQEENGNLQDENAALKLERDGLRAANRRLDSLLNSQGSDVDVGGSRKNPYTTSARSVAVFVPEHPGVSTSTATPKRGRGRPKKQSTDGEPPVKRPRGRPRKIVTEPPPPKRPRGRPRKNPVSEGKSSALAPPLKPNKASESQESTGRYFVGTPVGSADADDADLEDDDLGETGSTHAYIGDLPRDRT